MDAPRKLHSALAVVVVVVIGSSVAVKCDHRPAHGPDPLAGAWADNNGLVPPHPTGERFVLSHHYPERQPPKPDAPWNRALQGRRSPDSATVVPYMMELRKYVYDALLPVEWRAEKIRRGPNGERGWYQAPWLGEAYDTTQLHDRYAVAWPGQDYYHGLYFGTHLNPGTMPGQTATYDNYEQVFYNDLGGWGLSRMWSARGEARELKDFQFPEGTVIAKIVFTSAPATGALRGSPQWTVYVRPSCDTCSTPPAPRETRVTLIQMDIVTRDTEHAPETGWLFSTYVYDSTLVATERDPWKRMTPLGIMWGNDPHVVAGQPLKETVLNASAPAWFFANLGYGGRLSGPIDGAKGTGSCMGCHSSAEFSLDPNAKLEQFSRMEPPSNLTPDSSAFWLYFRNLRPNQAWTDSAGWVALDYSFVNTGALGHYYAMLGRQVGRNVFYERPRPPVPVGTARARGQSSR